MLSPRQNRQWISVATTDIANEISPASLRAPEQTLHCPTNPFTLSIQALRRRAIFHLGTPTQGYIPSRHSTVWLYSIQTPKGYTLCIHHHRAIAHLCTTVVYNLTFLSPSRYQFIVATKNTVQCTLYSVPCTRYYFTRVLVYTCVFSQYTYNIQCTRHCTYNIQYTQCLYSSLYMQYTVYIMFIQVIVHTIYSVQILQPMRYTQ